ncbi:hypothetical protein RCL1_001091 [Eukaryota sp. TZLM3-RCL]
MNYPESEIFPEVPATTPVLVEEARPSSAISLPEVSIESVETCSAGSLTELCEDKPSPAQFESSSTTNLEEESLDDQDTVHITISPANPPWYEERIRKKQDESFSRPFLDIPDDGWSDDDLGYDRVDIYCPNATRTCTFPSSSSLFMFFDTVYNFVSETDLSQAYKGMISPYGMNPETPPAAKSFGLVESDDSTEEDQMIAEDHEEEEKEEVFADEEEQIENDSPTNQSTLIASQLISSKDQSNNQSNLDYFDLPVYFYHGQTGFEANRELTFSPCEIVAGRYRILEKLGSAAFSDAYHAELIDNNIPLCLKVIKNNKDYFDQSLDEIKLLKLLNEQDQDDTANIVRLFDYFYYREHLFLAFELLKENLYEAFKYNATRENFPYFTLGRIQSIARQCLEALDFCHSRGIIHSDVKPENILVCSYSQTLIKLIDFGSSCFTSDHLSSYVQSRSYRAPEVLLGLAYDNKIDIWSLGCVLAELWTGEVLFLNDTIQTLLARIIGIIGPIPSEMIVRSKYGSKFFTGDFWLYDRILSERSGNVHTFVLVPKKTDLSQRLRCSDPYFLDFLSLLFTIDPDKRPTAAEALKHPFLDPSQVCYEENYPIITY